MKPTLNCRLKQIHEKEKQRASLSAYKFLEGISLFTDDDIFLLRKIEKRSRIVIDLDNYENNDKYEWSYCPIRTYDTGLAVWSSDFSKLTKTQKTKIAKTKLRVESKIKRLTKDINCKSCVHQFNYKLSNQCNETYAKLQIKTNT